MFYLSRMGLFLLFFPWYQIIVAKLAIYLYIFDGTCRKRNLTYNIAQGTFYKLWRYHNLIPPFFSLKTAMIISIESIPGNSLFKQTCKSYDLHLIYFNFRPSIHREICWIKSPFIFLIIQLPSNNQSNIRKTLIKLFPSN